MEDNEVLYIVVTESNVTGNIGFSKKSYPKVEAECVAEEYWRKSGGILTTWVVPENTVAETK
jgi:hypothetical protein